MVWAYLCFYYLNTFSIAQCTKNICNILLQLPICYFPSKFWCEHYMINYSCPLWTTSFALLGWRTKVIIALEVFYCKLKQLLSPCIAGGFIKDCYTKNACRNAASIFLHIQSLFLVCQHIFLLIVFDLHRPAEEITLKYIAANLRQEIHMLLCLYPFRDHRHAQLLCQCYDHL